MRSSSFDIKKTRIATWEHQRDKMAQHICYSFSVCVHDIVKIFCRDFPNLAVLIDSTGVLIEIACVVLPFRVSDALHLLQRLFNSSNQIKQIHTVLFTSNALVPSRWKTKCVYNTLIRSYLNSGQYKTSLALFTHMLASQVQPIDLTFPSLIKKAACSSFSVSYGVALHGQALKRGVLMDPFVQTSFVRCDLQSSSKMFDEIAYPCVIACNSLLGACGRNGEMDSAFELFQRMHVTDVVSWTSVINGFSKNGLE